MYNQKIHSSPSIRFIKSLWPKEWQKNSLPTTELNSLRWSQ